MPPSVRSPDRGDGGDHFYMIVFALGYLGAGALAAVDSISPIAVPPLIYAIWLAAATAVLIHRWLGGISAHAEGTVSGMRVTGGLAALIVLIFVLNPILEQQFKAPRNLDALFDPHYATWFPMQRNPVKPIEVRVQGTGDRLPRLSETETRNVRFRLTSMKEGLGVRPPQDEIILGVVSLEEVLRWMHPDAKVDDLDIVERVRAGKERHLGEFRLKTLHYGEDSESIELRDRRDSLLLNTRLGRSTFEQFHYGDKHYVLAVIGHDHTVAEPWASFALLRLVADFEVEGGS